MNKRHIKNPVIVEQEIQKSKFITYLFPITSEAEAKTQLQTVKKAHPKASHHCSAYIIGMIERSNDDGEPASSAGMPMLQVLRGHNLEGILAVVVRYFGGTLLGVGGLIRAYGSSVSLALEASEFLVPRLVYTYRVTFPYDYTQEVEQLVQTVGVIQKRDYEAQAIYEVIIYDKAALQALNDLTHGKAEVKYIKETLTYVKEEHHGIT